MANITIKSLVNDDLCAEVKSINFVRDLSEEQVNLRGGMCAFPTDENPGGCSDAIINFPQKFDLTKIIRKHK